MKLWATFVITALWILFLLVARPVWSRPYIEPDAVVVAESPAPISPPRPSTPPPSIFSYQGAWTVFAVHAHMDDIGWHEQLAARLVAEGYRWVAFPLTDGQGIGEWGASRYPRLQIYVERGLRVCGWSALGYAPSMEAAIIRSLLQSHPVFSCFIADAGPGYVQSWANYRPAASAEFVAGLGNVGAELALSVPGTAALDYQPWINAGYHVLPQAYICLDRWLTGAHVQPFFEAIGFPSHRIHPVFGDWNFNGWICHAPLSEYRSAWPGRLDWSLFVADGV